MSAHAILMSSIAWDMIVRSNVLFRLSETPGRITSAGPALGQHTEEVLAEIGIDADQVAELRRQGAV